MNPSLKDFFNEEKKRVFTPDPYFHTRVMARVREGYSPADIWALIPGSTRPVFGLALMLLLAFVAVEMYMPQIPERGFVTALLETEQTPAETFLLSGDDIPADQELLNQLMGAEER
jgi:hypothetical protein